jgi:hypothetical protein
MFNIKEIIHILKSQMIDSVRLSALRFGRPFPQEDSWYSFLSQLTSPQSHSEAGRIKSIKKAIIIGKQNSDLPACSTVLQPGETTE